MPNGTIKLLLYCTKAKPYLYNCYSESDGDIGTIGGFGYDTSYCLTKDEDSKDKSINLNGYIVAEAECELVEDIYCELLDNGVGTDTFYYTNNVDFDYIEELACLDINDLATYLPQKRGGEKVGYAIYLKNVKPFDEPKKLSYYGLEKAPQNMCFKRYPVPYENSLGGWEISKDTIIISIKPEWLCKILNGEKTIEVRKSILNLLKELMNNGK